jgi:hypothetical protein
MQPLSPRLTTARLRAGSRNEHVNIFEGKKGVTVTIRTIGLSGPTPHIDLHLTDWFALVKRSFYDADNCHVPRRGAVGRFSP